MYTNTQEERGAAGLRGMGLRRDGRRRREAARADAAGQDPDRRNCLILTVTLKPSAPQEIRRFLSHLVSKTLKIVRASIENQKKYEFRCRVGLLGCAPLKRFAMFFCKKRNVLTVCHVFAKQVANRKDILQKC